MKARNHKNTARLTATERARALTELLASNLSLIQYERAVVKALEAHAKEALARDDRRDK